jgi:hypothetical protein
MINLGDGHGASAPAGPSAICAATKTFGPITTSDG